MKFSQPNVLLILFLDSLLVPLLDHSILGFPIVHVGVADGGVAMFRIFLLQESHRYIDLTSRIYGKQKNLVIICGRWQAQNFFFYVDPTLSSIASISMATILKCSNNCLNIGYMRQALTANPCIYENFLKTRVAFKYMIWEKIAIRCLSAHAFGGHAITANSCAPLAFTVLNF